MDDKPVRIRLSRRRGFDLQAVSRKINGREAVKVTRPGRWGNPFAVAPNLRPGTPCGGKYTRVSVLSAEDAVEQYRIMLRDNPSMRIDARTELRGKNLACWCAGDRPCHADALLEIANQEVPTQGDQSASME